VATSFCGSPVENIPLQAERHSGRRQKLFAFPPESRSPSDRNAVRNHNGMVFIFRPESRSSSTGFPTLGSLRRERLSGNAVCSFRHERFEQRFAL